MDTRAEIPDIASSDPDEVDSFWRSLRYFSVYRLVVAAVFLVVFLITGGRANIASQDPALFLWADSLYLVAAFGFLLFMQRAEHTFNQLLTFQVICDVVLLTVLMYASGGAKSGITVMLVVVVAAAGLVGQGRLTLFYAALATVAILFEQAFRVLHFSMESDDFTRAGLTSIGFFATAIIARFLAQRVIANENLARQRGIELANQVRINQQVILDMEDGVLVVDADKRVRLHNPQAETLLSISAPPGDTLSDYSPALASHLEGRPVDEESTDILKVTNGRTLLVRQMPPEDGGGNTLVYLQDLDRAQAQARQMKLAALGRLTANIAHEIRNPLAAISNAGELLADEQRADTRARLVRIIGDNANRLNQMVGEVMELGRRDRVQKDNIALLPFLTQIVEEYALTDSSAAGRIVIVGAEGLMICFDRSHLYRILENLLTNALRYASEARDAIRIEAITSGAERVEVHVVDDGPGIAEADCGKVFEPFFTTRGSGTGLGLYISRELCEANGASLDLVDDPRGGHFRIAAKGRSCQ